MAGKRDRTGWGRAFYPSWGVARLRMRSGPEFQRVPGAHLARLPVVEVLVRVRSRTAWSSYSVMSAIAPANIRSGKRQAAGCGRKAWRPAGHTAALKFELAGAHRALLEELGTALTRSAEPARQKRADRRRDSGLRGLSGSWASVRDAGERSPAHCRRGAQRQPGPPLGSQDQATHRPSGELS